MKEVGDGRAHVELPAGAAWMSPSLLKRRAASGWAFAEHLTLAASQDPAAAFAGVVAIVERLGNSTISTSIAARQSIVEGEGNLSIKSGDRVGLALAARQAHLFDAEGVVV